jgi:6-phosphogluconolactonase (cycloisomerase 2 family)
MKKSTALPLSNTNRKMAGMLLVLLAVAMLFTGNSRSVLAAEEGPKAVYVMTNETTGNAIMVYNRGADGSLTPAGTVATNGTGTGAGLGSQGGLILAENNRWLFAVNAGSNSISSFEVRPDGLHLMGTYDSQGTQPTSLTTYGNLVYVLNVGDNGNLAGFVVDKGQLTPIPGSIQPISSSARAAQIQFSANGNQLVVTERATNQIVTYAVVNGVAQGGVVNPSAGAVPFGFDIDRQDHLIVSEAQGAAQGTGASSYSLNGDGSITAISQSVANGQGAACWLVIAKNGHFAYTANAATNNISSYTIANDGSLAVLQADVTTDMQPLDMDITVNGQYLYVIDGRSDTIRSFAVNGDGTLTDIGVQAPVVATAVGMAAN